MRLQVIAASIIAVASLLLGTGFLLSKNAHNGNRDVTLAKNIDALGRDSDSYSAEPINFVETRADLLYTAEAGDVHRLAYVRTAYSFTGSPAVPPTTLISTSTPSNLTQSSIYNEDFYLYAGTVDVTDAQFGVNESNIVPIITNQTEQINEYKVVSGDTLWAIGVRFETNWPTLVKLNAVLNPDLIHPGQAIRLPNTSIVIENASIDSQDIITSSNEIANELSERIHTVQSGDTLWRIGYEHGLSWTDIAETNAIPNPDLIYPGEQLVLAKSDSVTKAYASLSVPSSAYAVRPIAPVAPVSTSISTSTIRQVAPVAAPVNTSVSTVRQVAPSAQPAFTGIALQSGMATWYGPGFEGNTTYCGQRYDSSQYTAASNTLPCGAVVTVSNQATGASVTVTVTDRGAFTHTIDLSHAAFSAIASPSAGVAPIVVTSAK